jgi:hypothetical protein
VRALLEVHGGDLHASRLRRRGPRRRAARGSWCRRACAAAPRC